MNTHALCRAVALMVAVFLARTIQAQESTPPFSPEEREAAYTTSIAKRAGAILELLQLSDTAKSNRLHGIITSQYRALRARDEAIDGMLKALSANAPGAETNRPAILNILSRQLHQQFLSRLSAELSPEQTETVKDKMTYNKVKVTFDAYCNIVPNLSGAEKERIVQLLKEAREEAIDGGSADEKSAIFQKYKDQINAYLGGNGHDVAKATREWEAKQASTTPESDGGSKP